MVDVVGQFCYLYSSLWGGGGVGLPCKYPKKGIIFGVGGALGEIILWYKMFWKEHKGGGGERALGNATRFF